MLYKVERLRVETKSGEINNACFSCMCPDYVQIEFYEGS